MQGDSVTWLALVHRMVDGGRRGYVLDPSPEPASVFPEVRPQTTSLVGSRGWI
jgi:hypothetical protein